jgi:hypothetical protein
LEVKELAEYLHKRIQKIKWRSRGELFQELTISTLKFWIQQYLVKDSCGHSEWSERYKRNIWIKDVDNISEIEER